MDEIEVKVIDVDSARSENRLVSLGAKKVFEGNIETHFFDFDNHSIIDSGDLLRLRKEGERVILSYKRFVGSKDAKVTKEYEVMVSDFDNTWNILVSLGLKVYQCLKKRRKSYELDDVRFEFDKYENPYAHIPEFIEIEAKDIKSVHRYAKLLGFGVENCRPWSTKDLIDHYSK